MGSSPTLPPKPDDKSVEVENVVLEAWALSETAAQVFIKRVTDTVSIWDLQVRDPKVTFNKGPMNANGFSISMRLVKLAGPEGKIIRLSDKKNHETTSFE
jgi:hypothetical protein